MTITVTPKSATANATSTKKTSFTLIDHSGAHTILTVTIPGSPPVSHAFGIYEGRYQADVALAEGIYNCTFTVQAFENDLNGMYNCALEIDGASVSSANGNIPNGQSFDSGFGSVQLTVI